MPSAGFEIHLEVSRQKKIAKANSVINRKIFSFGYLIIKEKSNKVQQVEIFLLLFAVTSAISFYCYSLIKD